MIVGIGAAVVAGVASTQGGQGTDVVAPLAIAGVFGASSAYGMIQVGRCRAEHEKRPGWSLAEMPAVM
jgi:hypothetical protein